LQSGGDLGFIFGRSSTPSIIAMRARSAPILECAPQAAGNLGNIRLTSSDSGSRRILVFRIQITTNEARNALPSFRGQWPRTSEFDQLLLNAGNGKQEPNCDQIALGDSVCQLFKPVCGELLIFPESAIRHTQEVELGEPNHAVVDTKKQGTASSIYRPRR
jgi:hypothetical protein